MNTNNMHIPSNKVRDIERYFFSELKDLYPDGEIRMFIRLLFEAYMGWGLTALLLHHDDTINQSDLLRFHWAAEDLRNHRPIQHIIGHCEFCDCTINVSPDVLIPRPETAEMVDWITSNWKNGAPHRIVDLCTGSGCIAIALKRRFLKTSVNAVDVSSAALSLAQKNAITNGTDIQFIESNLLTEDPLTGSYDLIVSNPPYIRLSERADMSANVLDFEPSIALFVPDNDPLLFYRRICTLALLHLNTDGLLVLEINEHWGQETCALLNESGLISHIHNDFNGKPRMIVARKAL